MTRDWRRLQRFGASFGLDGLVILFIAIVALAAGLYGRLEGLGFSPLATDEYFIVRSTQNILERGLPQWSCGGLYLRALLLQYAIAPLLWAGVSPELAVRIPSALASLAGLPAVYLLARRLGGLTSALIAVALVAISIWEIEMARFGRMYAPFQTAFLWYLYFLHRVIIENDRRARIGLLALSSAGALIWEGGIFLLALSYLPLVWHAPQSPPERDDIPYAATAAVLIAVALSIYLPDTRNIGPVPSVPPDLQLPVEYHPGVQPLFVALWREPLWLLPALLPLAAAVGAFVEARRNHAHLLVQSTVSLCAALLLIHQYALAGLLAAILTLAGWVDLKSFAPRRSPWLWGLALVAFVFWGLFAVFTDGWLNGQEFSGVARARLVLAAFLKQPSVLRAVVEPWIEAVPALAVWTGLLLLTALVAALWIPSSRNDGLPLLVAAILLPLAGVGYADPYFQTTRYSFFLYPAVILAGVVAIGRILERTQTAHRYAGIATLGLVCIPFVATEDFDLRHLRTIDSPKTIFRAGYPWPLTKHYYQRYDFRGASEWLGARAHDEDLVLSTVAVFDFYYPKVDYVYRSPLQPIFREESCRLARAHRWSGLPQIYLPERVITEIEASRGNVWLITARDDLWITDVFDRYKRERVWLGADGHLQVWRVRASKASPPFQRPPSQPAPKISTPTAAERLRPLHQPAHAVRRNGG